MRLNVNVLRPRKGSISILLNTIVKQRLNRVCRVPIRGRLPEFMMKKFLGAIVPAALLCQVCPLLADVTYTLHLGSSTEEQQVAASVAAAAAQYNQYGSFNKHWDVYYNPGIPTAEANYSGYMGFGSQRTVRTVMHEGAHTMGMGTTSAYASLISGGVWAGAYGRQAELDTYNDYADGLHGDGHAIWPGGFNYENEDGYIERIWMVRIQAAMRCDMGMLAYSQEARNELVHPGETAEFRIASPVAASFQWFKNGSPVMNGGDVTGATSPVLRIANAEAGDQGSYYCAATGAGETLNSRTRQLWVMPAQELGQWNMDGTVSDSVNTNHGTAYGAPAYVAGKFGLAVDLDGIDDYVQLPAAAAMAKEITVATWVNWDGGNNWQRIFDFGTGIYQNMFLTPKSGGSTMRFVLKDSVNGTDAEKQINTTALPVGQWVHLAVVLKRNYATLYANGRAVGSVLSVSTHPSDFLPTQNYIGKSQYADPLFNGRIDDFRIYNHALDGASVWQLWGQSSNQAPMFHSDGIELPNAIASLPYSGPDLSNYVSDAELDALTFSKLGGPEWLSVAANGTLSGTPRAADQGFSTLIVRVTDASGASSDAEMPIEVAQPPVDFGAGPVARWDFNDPGLGAATGVALPDSDGSTVWRVAAIDKSGYGNHLTTWEYDWAGFNWSTNSSQKDFSIVAAGTYPAAFTWSAQSLPPHADVESLVLSNFTVEALFTATGSGFRTVLGRDARNASISQPNNAALYFGIDGSDHPLIEFTDMSGNTVRLMATATVLDNNTTWYHMAGVHSGTNISLYLNGVRIASTNRVMGAMANNSVGTASGPGWHAGGWSVARGLWSGDHVDRWYGLIDEIAISGKALTPATFAINNYSLWLNAYNLAGAPFAGDADGDGVLNGVEYYLGTDPTNTLSPSRALKLADDLRSVSYPFKRAATGVTGVVEWTTDLANESWTSSGVSYVTNSISGAIAATVAVAPTNQLFLRLKVIK